MSSPTISTLYENPQQVMGICVVNGVDKQCLIAYATYSTMYGSRHFVFNEIQGKKPKTHNIDWVELGGVPICLEAALNTLFPWPFCDVKIRPLIGFKLHVTHSKSEYMF